MCRGEYLKERERESDRGTYMSRGILEDRERESDRGTYVSWGILG